MNNLGYNPGFNQMTGDMQFQHHPSEQGPQNQMQTYQNSGYSNKRGKIKTLILDVKDGDVTLPGTTVAVTRNHLGRADEFNIELFEPLIIDKQSVIYLDNLITFNCNLSNETQSSAFCLHINEFNIETNTFEPMDYRHSWEMIFRWMLRYKLGKISRLGFGNGTNWILIGQPTCSMDTLSKIEIIKPHKP